VLSHSDPGTKAAAARGVDQRREENTPRAWRRVQTLVSSKGILGRARRRLCVSMAHRRGAARQPIDESARLASVDPEFGIFGRLRHHGDQSARLAAPTARADVLVAWRLNSGHEGSPDLPMHTTHVYTSRGTLSVRWPTFGAMRRSEHPAGWITGLWQAVQIVAKVRDHLAAAFNNGKLAQRELDDLAERKRRLGIFKGSRKDCGGHRQGRPD
jgi:hypothetical protein